VSPAAPTDPLAGFLSIAAECDILTSLLVAIVYAVNLGVLLVGNIDAKVLQSGAPLLRASTVISAAYGYSGAKNQNWLKMATGGTDG
jgi:hypothetical protein